jgi:hypothetical protein
LPEQQKRPILILLTSHWISMAGVALVTLAGFSWLFLLPQHLRGQVDNPYIGLLLFGAVPAVFFVGLALIPIGLALARRQVVADFSQLPNRQAAWRRAGIFFVVMTLANLLIGSQLTYRAVEHMETVQFCGQSCHVMQPEFMAHGLPPHQSVGCASCHIGPGASGWFAAKIAGMRQLKNVALNSFPRPIEAGLESNRLASSADTCEQCHARDRVIGPRLRVKQKYKDDQNNTAIESVLMMKVGGGATGGIHGAHMGPGVHIRYAASDKKRQIIPWVEVGVEGTAEKRTYVASDAKPAAVASLPVFDMQCADCHNRAAHSFQSPENAIDEAIAAGQIAPSLPFVKKTGLELIKASYASQDEAAQKIQAGLNAFYQSKYGDVWTKQSGDVQRAGQALAAAYGHNVFPDLKVTWGTYPNNLGHMDDPGCFRCHDGSHETPTKKSITQDCSSCHDLLSVEESSPAILKTLGLEVSAQNGKP